MVDKGVFSVFWFSCVFLLCFVSCQTSAQDVPEEDCVCVWFYLCPNGSLIRDGAGLITPRAAEPVKKICSGTGYVCCPVDLLRNNSTGSTPPPVRNYEQVPSRPPNTQPPMIDRKTPPLQPPSQPRPSPPSQPRPSPPSQPRPSPPSQPKPIAPNQPRPNPPNQPRPNPTKPPRPNPPNQFQPRPRPPNHSHTPNQSGPRPPLQPEPNPPNRQYPPNPPNQFQPNPPNQPRPPHIKPGPNPSNEPDETEHVPDVAEGPLNPGSQEIKPEANPVFVPRPGCGVKRLSVQKRVSFISPDESIAEYAEFPWMLAILAEVNPPVLVFRCGASLIQPQVALTAAHCVSGFAENLMRVRAGEWNTKTDEEPLPHQDRHIYRIDVHPYYNSNNLNHDIALIFLTNPFNLTASVDTICLPDENAVYNDTRCTATGWGKESSGPDKNFHQILHKVDLPIVPCGECQNRLRRTLVGPYFELHHSFMCAGGELNRDTCKGDGGGPLVCPTGAEGRWEQVGIVSWGVSCGTTAPAVYTDVPRHLDWINTRIADFKKEDESPDIDQFGHFLVF